MQRGGGELERNILVEVLIGSMHVKVLENALEKINCLKVSFVKKHTLRKNK